jgi:SAM-dependent methyltransferase
VACIVAAFYTNSAVISLFLMILAALSVLNIFLAVFASYILYDQSDLFKLDQLPQNIRLSKLKEAVLIHASFDPISKKLEQKHPNLKLTVFDIYGNRHEHESVVNVSNKVFPPHPDQTKVDPTQLPLEDHSQDIILAVTALHEILKHDKRVAFFKEAKRVLKKDGVIIVSEQLRDFTNFVAFNIGAFHFLSKSKWEKAISEAGLTIIDNQKLTIFANTMVVK